MLWFHDCKILQRRYFFQQDFKNFSLTPECKTSAIVCVLLELIISCMNDHNRDKAELCSPIINMKRMPKIIMLFQRISV